MAMLKCTMVFQAATGTLSTTQKVKRVGSWTETYYHVHDPVINGGDAFLQMNLLCEKRAALLPKTSFIAGQRFQSVDPIGGASTRAVVFPGNSAYETDTPNTALFFSAAGSGVVNARPTWIRNVPDVMVVDGEYAPTTAYHTLVQDFLNTLTNQAWEFYGLDLTKPAYQIHSISADGTVKLEVPSSGYAVDMLVSVLRTVTASLKKKGGKFLIETMTTPTSFKLKDWPHGACKGGKIREVAYDFHDIGGPLEISRVGSKKIGSPRIGFRGRR